jgi:hypothetical protein
MHMRNFLTAFAYCFVALFIYGYWQGHEFVAQRDFVEQFAFSRVTLERDTDPASFAFEGYYLVYRAHGAPIYRYALKDNLGPKHLQVVALTALASRLGPPAWEYSILNDSSIPKIIGGVTFGFTAKDLIAKTAKAEEFFAAAKSHRNAIFGAILGSITGYSAGKWFATRHSLPAEDSGEVLETLKHEDKWAAKKQRYS